MVIKTKASTCSGLPGFPRLFEAKLKDDANLLDFRHGIIAKVACCALKPFGAIGAKNPMLPCALLRSCLPAREQVKLPSKRRRHRSSRVNEQDGVAWYHISGSIRADRPPKNLGGDFGDDFFKTRKMCAPEHNDAGRLREFSEIMGHGGASDGVVLESLFD
jgi:hypothetical protein